MTQALQRPTTFHNIMPRNLEYMFNDYSAALCKAHPDAISEEAMIVAMNRMRVALVDSVARDGGDRLHNCSTASWAAAIAKSAMTGLYPGGHMPDVWLIPRKGAVNWQLAARGAANLAERVGWEIRTGVVFEGDDFKYTEEPPMILHAPGPRDFDDSDPAKEWEAVEGIYVVCEELQTGRKRYGYMRRGAIERRREVSESYKKWLAEKKSSPWVTWPVEMGRTTLLKYAQGRGLFPRRILDVVDRAEMIVDSVAAPSLPAGPGPLSAIDRALHAAAVEEPQGSLIAPGVVMMPALEPEGDGHKGLTDEEKAAILAEEAANAE